MDHNVIVSDYAAMDRVLKEERAYILNIVKQIKKSGCNVLLVQKSILRDAVSDLALHFLDKIKVMVIKDVEREDIEFISKVSALILTTYYCAHLSLRKHVRRATYSHGVKKSILPKNRWLPFNIFVKQIFFFKLRCAFTF